VSTIGAFLVAALSGLALAAVLLDVVWLYPRHMRRMREGFRDVRARLRERR